LAISVANLIFIDFELVLEVAVGGRWVCGFVFERVSEPALHFHVGNVVRHVSVGVGTKITRI